MRRPDQYTDSKPDVVICDNEKTESFAAILTCNQENETKFLRIEYSGCPVEAVRALVHGLQKDAAKLFSEIFIALDRSQSIANKTTQSSIVSVRRFVGNKALRIRRLASMSCGAKLMIHARLVLTMTPLVSFVTVPGLTLDSRKVLVETLSMGGTASVRGDLSSLAGNVWKR